MKIKAFTLIELLVVVAIIGILAAVGTVAYTGYTKSAKKSAANSNHGAVCRWIATEVQKIALGIDGDMFSGKITTSSILATYKADGNPMGTLTQAIVDAAEKKFKNPYGDQGRVGDIGVTNSGWGSSVDLGYTIIDPTGPHDGKIGILHVHTCIELPCTGNYKTEDLAYIKYCPIEVWP
mgnify:FL=1